MSAAAEPAVPSLSERREAHSSLKTLDVILLGLLATGERTGYDVRKWLDQYGVYVGYTTQTSQIYRQLGRLVDLGWATARTERRDGVPDAKLYALTDAGRQEFQAWMDSPYVPARRPLDPDFQLRLRFAGRTSPEKMLELVRSELAFRREQELARVPFDEAIMVPGCDAAEARWQKQFWRLASERGHYMVRALIAWLEAAETRLEELCAER